MHQATQTETLRDLLVMKVGVEEVNPLHLVAAVPPLPGGVGPNRLVAVAGMAAVAEKEEAVVANSVTGQSLLCPIAAQKHSSPLSQ